jgi:membrane-associated phospholipid phosphatase
MGPLWQTFKTESIYQLTHVGRWLWKNRLIVLLSLGVLGLIAVFTVPHDKTWVKAARASLPGAHGFAKGLSFWGDYPFIGLIPGLGLFLLGQKTSRLNLARFGLALLLASSTAGLTTNMLRNSLGRPRPMAKVPDGLYGPSIKYKFHGSPSGHAGAAFGAATFVAVALPPLALPALGFAASIGWSRVYLRAHHPTDVAFGALFGLWAGTGFGLLYRRRLTDGELTPARTLER